MYVEVKTWIIEPLMFKRKVIMLFLASLLQAHKHAFSEKNKKKVAFHHHILYSL